MTELHITKELANIPAKIRSLAKQHFEAKVEVCALIGLLAQPYYSGNGLVDSLAGPETPQVAELRMRFIPRSGDWDVTHVTSAVVGLSGEESLVLLDLSLDDLADLLEHIIKTGFREA